MPDEESKPSPVFCYLCHLRLPHTELDHQIMQDAAEDEHGAAK